MCGFCQNGMMIKATELLDSNPSPTVAQIKDGVHERARRRTCAAAAATRPSSTPCSARPTADGEGEVSDGHQRDTSNVHGATLTRRQFVKTGGALVVGVSLARPRGCSSRSADGRGHRKNSLDAALSSSWFEIHADNTILMRTGKVDFGQTTAHTAYKQIVAEELNVPFEAITTVVMGDTDRTPDGGVLGRLPRIRRQPNLRKAAAYTYQALLDLAATTLGVDKSAALGEGRRRLRRRQEHVVRRARARPGAEADDSGRRATLTEHVRPDGRPAIRR